VTGALPIVPPSFTEQTLRRYLLHTLRTSARATTAAPDPIPEDVPMVSSKETTPAAYLASLPPERRKVIAAVRAVVKKRLPKGYVETMNWGMLSYEIPLSRYPDAYNKQPLMYLALAAQKNNYALYMTSVSGDKALMDKLVAAYKAVGKKLDMAKSCLRFQKLEDLPLDLIGDIVASTPVERRIEAAEAARRKKK
jgi:uncharacterized protein YdhG (YjbR/CyaY superfamily)